MTGVPEWVERNPRWPLAPLCDCGAGPWLTGAPCLQAAARGCGGADVEECPRMAGDRRQVRVGGSGMTACHGVPRSSHLRNYAFTTFRIFVTSQFREVIHE